MDFLVAVTVAVAVIDDERILTIVFIEDTRKASVADVVSAIASSFGKQQV